MALREQVDIWAMPQSPTAFGGALRARAPLSLRDISPRKIPLSLCKETWDFEILRYYRSYVINQSSLYPDREKMK